MRFIADDDIPTAVWRLEFLLYVFIGESLSSRAMTRLVSRNQLPVRGHFELVVGEDLEGQVETAVEFILPLLGQAAGQTTRQRCRLPRAISSFIKRPAMIVLPAPGSSASRKRSGWRGSMVS